MRLVPSGSQRDTIYRLLIAAGDIAPIPVVGPCVELVKIIDQSFRRVRVRRNQCDEMTQIAQSVLMQVVSLVGDETETNGNDRTEEGALINRDRDGRSERTNTLVTNLERILRSLAQLAKEMGRKSVTDMLLNSAHYDKKLDALKKEFEHLIEEFKIGGFVKLEAWLENFQAARKADQDTLEELLSVHFRNMMQEIRRELRNPKEISFPKEKPLSSEDYINDVLPKFVGDKNREIHLHDKQLRIGSIIRSRPINTGGPAYTELVEALPLNCERFFVKIYYQRMNTAEVINGFIDELELCRKLEHENIVRVYGVNPTIGSRADCSLNLVMELCEEGQILSYIDREFTATKKYPNTLKMLSGIASAVDYLHTGITGGNPVCHGDIRPSKIVVNANGIAKLTGFRRAQIFNAAQKGGNVKVFTANRDNERWKAPEVVVINRENKNAGHTDYPLACDIYSWGITAGAIMGAYFTEVKGLAAVSEMVITKPFSGVPPNALEAIFLRRNRAKSEREDEKDTLRPWEPFLPRILQEIQHKYGEEVLELLMDCWKEDGSERPTIGEVVKRLGDLGGFN